MHLNAELQKIARRNKKAFLSDLPAAAKSLLLCPTLCNPVDRTHKALPPEDALSKNTGVGCHFLLYPE